jgi:hypothetical protein
LHIHDSTGVNLFRFSALCISSTATLLFLLVQLKVDGTIHTLINIWGLFMGENKTIENFRDQKAGFPLFKDLKLLDSLKNEHIIIIKYRTF